MTETSGGNASPAPVQGPGEAQQSGLRTTVMVCYVLYLLAFITGLTALAGVIIAYIKKPEAKGTVWESHFRSLIVVFWVMFAVLVLGFLTLPVSLLSLAAFYDTDFAWPALSAFALPALVWMVVLPIFLVWFLYRMIRGLIRVSEDRAY